MKCSCTCSVAKDRVWFEDDYAPVDCMVYSVGGCPPVQVTGIGTVRLPVRTSFKPGPNSHGALHLFNVLHVPKSLVNIIGKPALDDFNVEFLPPSAKAMAKLTTHANAKTVALFKNGVGDLSGLPVVRLSGYPVGPRVAPPRPSSGCKGMVVSVNWPASEQEKCFRQKKANSPISSRDQSGALTNCEYQWLKHHYGSEFRFLTVHGLSIYKEDDRQEGRSILRHLRAQDDLRDHKRVDESVDVERNKTMAPASSTGDGVSSAEDRRKARKQILSSRFSREEIDYINRDWGNTASFMHHLGLDFYDEDDCCKAKAMATKFTAMSNEQDEDDRDVYAIKDSSSGMSANIGVERPGRLMDHLFSERELYYINRDHGNSAIFMKHMGLNLDDSDDCLEAREIAASVYSDIDDGDDESLADNVLSYLNVGMGLKGPRQLADHFFSEEELDFVNNTYGDSVSFMMSLGLEFYRENDCRKAKSIAAALLSNDDQGGDAGFGIRGHLPGANILRGGC